MPGRSLVEKIWDQHVIARLSEDTDLLSIDRHLLHDLGGSRGLLDLKSRGLKVHNPELTFATPDHALSTAPGRAGTSKIGQELLAALRTETAASGITLFDVDQPGQGIVHVIGPELGLSLPGATIVCGDSHTCTHGGLGALAFGIGSSELTHVLATQALIQKRPKTLRARFEGKLPLGVTAKDMILALIGHIGAAGGTGYAVEYAGSAIRALPIEGRLTICNLSIELGAKMGMVAPDEKTFEFLRGRPYAPQGEMWDLAVKAWRELPSDPDAVFDREVVIDVEKIIPQVTWGISPEHVVGVDGVIPDPKTVDEPARRAAIETALEYMGLQGGAPIAGTPVDWVFIGSCTNSRLSDLRAAAEVVRRAARSRPGSAPGWCRARKTSSARRWPKGSTRSSSMPASNGASRAARCAWPPMARWWRPGSARSRPRTATSSAGRGRARGRIWRAPQVLRPRPLPARSPMSG
ncbi:3-isopropylmalate/(R)-2-methylmalate dehydratase large subunit [Bradyrhizobium sp. JR6.1]